MFGSLLVFLHRMLTVAFGVMSISPRIIQGSLLCAFSYVHNATCSIDRIVFGGRYAKEGLDLVGKLVSSGLVKKHTRNSRPTPKRDRH